MKYRIAQVLFALVAIGLAVGLWWTLPQLDEQIQLPCYDEEATVSSLLTAVSGVALNEENHRVLQLFIDEIARSPAVRRIMVSTKDKLVVVKTWEINEADVMVFLPEDPDTHWRVWDVDYEGQPVGHISVQFEDCHWPLTRRHLIWFGSVVGGVLILLMLLAAWMASTRWDYRLHALRVITDKVARGDLEVRIDPRGRDELGKLSRAFDRMLQSVQRSIKSLRASEERFNLAITGANDAIWDWNIENNLLYLSPRFREILDYPPGEDLPRLFNAWLQLIHSSDRERVHQEIRDHIERGDVPFQSEFRMRAHDGSWCWVLGRGQGVIGPTGKTTRMVGSLTDITERKQAEKALAAEKERAQVTLKSIGDGVITTDVDGNVDYLNSTAEKLTGWSNEAAAGHPIHTVFTVIHEQKDSPLPNPVVQVLSTASPLLKSENTILRDRQGEQYYIEYTAAPITSNDGVIVGVVLVFRNITERRKLLHRLSYQASHDALTNLLNRYAFEKRLETAIDNAKQYGGRHILCYLDLDQFKIVNDTSGHTAGDELLRQIAILLHAQFRSADTLARIGGDEFGLLLDDCPLEVAMEKLEQVRKAVKEFRFIWEDKTFCVGLSVGVLELGGAEGSPTDLLSIVDQACYIAKNKGRDQIHVFQPDDAEASRWRGDVEWARRLQDALDDDRFVLFAQPIIALAEDQKDYRHYEILLRMKDPDGKIIAPGAFLPAAERYGMMRVVDRWVVKNAIESVATAWADHQHIPVHTFAINLSGGLLGEKSFLDFIKQTFKQHDVPPEIFCFEITETVAIANFTHAQAFMNELKELGCRFSLDDFGSGFASFSYLKTLPVDYLKIDGSFVRHMDTQPMDYAMVKVINDIGRVMNLKTIAEFVENDDIVTKLKELGVDFAQGYHFGKPQPLYEVCYGGEEDEK